MAFSSNGNNLGGMSRGGILGRPVSLPNQPNSAPTITSPAPASTAPTQPASPAPNTSAQAAPNSQQILSGILGNNALTPQQKQQQIQSAGLGTMPIIYGNQSGSTPGAIAGGAPPPPNYTPTFSDQINKLYGANPLNLLGGSNGVTGVGNMSQAMDQINQHRAALGSNFMNNNAMGAAGTFSPVVTGQNFQSQASPLSSLLNYINILGSNRSNNYTS
jgi:hypothetical protein